MIEMKKFVRELATFFDEQIEYVRKSSIGTPKKLTLDLTVAQNNLELNITGNFFYVINSADPDHYIDVRFNEVREPDFRLVQLMGFYTPFHRVFLTWPVQATGSMTVVYGTLSKEFLDIIDNRSASSAVLDAIRDELRGDLTPEGMAAVAVNAAATQIVAQNANRKSVMVGHRHDGVGFIYVGFTNAVTANVHVVRLAPDEYYSISDYRGAIWAIRSAGATNAVYGEV